MPLPSSGEQGDRDAEVGNDVVLSPACDLNQIEQLVASHVESKPRAALSAT